MNKNDRILLLEKEVRALKEKNNDLHNMSLIAAALTRKYPVKADHWKDTLVNNTINIANISKHIYSLLKEEKV